MAYLYPYGDTQQLNLDWLIEQWNEVKSQIDGSLQAEIDRVEAAITDLLTARDEAVAAQTAAQASAQAAAGSASTASGAASTATAQAQAASGSAATAGAHASDAQGYAATAQQEAQAAHNDAASAAVSAGNAHNDATAAAGAAAQAVIQSNSALNSALDAEAWAKGTKGDTPVTSQDDQYENNSKYYAGEANTEALKSEGFAIGEQNGVPVSSGSPYYQNNAKYYLDAIPPDYSSLAESVEYLTDSVDTLAPLELNHGTWTQGSIFASDGTTTSSTSVYRTDYLDLTGIDVIYYSRPLTTSASPQWGAAVFYDSSKAFISSQIPKTADAVGLEMTELTVPSGAAYVRFCCGQSTKDSWVWYNKEQYINNTQTDVAELQELVTVLQKNTDLDIETIPFTLSGTNTFVRYTNGTTAGSSTYDRTDYVDVSDYDYLIYKNGSTTNASVQAGTAFYDDTYTFISGIQVEVVSSAAGYIVNTAKVPLNAKYAMFNTYQDTGTRGNFALYGIRHIFGKIGGQWKGKNWYAYGTSITSPSVGNYTEFLSAMLGTTLSNKGVPGGGICANTDTKTAVMNITDGKLDADLITLEVGSNDRSAALGTIYDTGDSTFCGALNQCIRYLQANTTAQIVIFSSPQQIYKTGDPSDVFPPEHVYTGGYTAYEMVKAIEEVCRVNGVYYVPTNDGIGAGYARVNTTLYTTDYTHQTVLGGFNWACGIYEYIKRIPLWYHNKMTRA